MNFANKITLFRLLLLPLMWVSALLGHTYLLIMLIMINAFGDIADGYVARKFKQETIFGAKFDGYVDMLVYSSILAWSILFYQEKFSQNLIIALMIIIIVPLITSLIKFKKIIVFHLISSKVLAMVIIISFILVLLIPHWFGLCVILIMIATVYNSIERCLIIIFNKKKVPEKIKSMFVLLEK